MSGFIRKSSMIKLSKRVRTIIVTTCVQYSPGPLVAMNLLRNQQHQHQHQQQRRHLYHLLQLVQEIPIGSTTPKLIPSRVKQDTLPNLKTAITTILLHGVNRRKLTSLISISALEMLLKAISQQITQIKLKSRIGLMRTQVSRRIGTAQKVVGPSLPPHLMT